MDPNTYCNEPWRTAHYDDVGDLGPCCTYRGVREKFNSLDDYWNSEWLQKFREDLNQGVRPDGCRHCWLKEDRGEHSQRTDKNERWGIIQEPQLKELFLSFGNICNKSCGICRPSRSSLIAKEYKTIPSDNAWRQAVLTEKKRQQTVALAKNYSGQYLDQWENYKTGLASAEIIYLDGGEPFVVDQCTKILEYMIAQGMTNKHIKAGTNGSATPYQLELLSQFNKVSFHLSIDGIEDLYKVVRPPHSWDWWNTQHNQIQKYPFNITYACVAHAFNVHQLPEIVDYFISQRQINPNTFIFFSQINSQQHLECSVVPVEVMDKTIESLKSRLPNMTAEDQKQIHRLITHLQVQRDVDDPVIKQNFQLYCDTFSRIKNINYGEYIPWINQ